MTPSGTTHFNKTENSLTLTRIINAPRALVFKAWIDPRHLREWWGPKGFTNPRCDIDVRPGGAIRIDMRGPDGTVYPMSGEYLEIIAPSRIVFTSAALDKNGKPMFNVLNTIIFEEHNGKTKLILEAVASNVKPEAAMHIAGMEEGWKQSIDRLEAYVAAV
jgi:uncharacterized protein YndB with AHSA1/START domain